MQYSKNAGQMQNSSNAGQYGCRTGQMQYRSDAGQERAGYVRGRKGHMQLRSDAGGQVRCITGLMQDRTYAVQDRTDASFGKVHFPWLSVCDRLLLPVCNSLRVKLTPCACAVHAQPEG